MFPDEQLEYWADEFVQRGYARYMNLDQFLRDPAGTIERMDALENFRPLLPAQIRAAHGVLRQAPKPRCLLEVIDELEATVANLPTRNGHPFQPLKHHAYPR